MDQAGRQAGHVDIDSVPTDLRDIALSFIPLEQVVYSGSLVCKARHNLIERSDLLWLIFFFHRDILELRDPLPYQAGGIVDLDEADMEEETS